MTVEDSNLRSRRKAEHMEAVRTLADTPAASWFQDVKLLPNCAPEVDVADVSLATTLCGVKLASPIVINAMTGGTEEALVVNQRLARLARRYGLAMAVGSETAAVRDATWEHTYTVVRDEHPEGAVIANVGMSAPTETALAAVELLHANLLQIHWNVAQEMFMAEGDRAFHGALDRLAETVSRVDVPVIAKEVGQGVAAPEAVRFVQAGVSAIDVGGRGGTNFMAVEVWRQGEALDDDWQDWGIPTPVALCEVVQAVGKKVDVVASGGIRTGHDIAKAVALGASAVGIAGPLLRLVSRPDGEAAVAGFIEHLHDTLRKLLVLTGSRTWADLRKRPVVIRGDVRDWLVARGMATFISEVGSRDERLHSDTHMGFRLR